jgi:nicotinate-nucleotide adenylyltransferase
MERGKPDFMGSVEMNSRKKIGLFGGSFDPVHHGHLILARDAMEQLGLERIVFIPANISPHKLGLPPAPAHLRRDMLAAAIEGESGFEIDTCEIDREGVSFAVDTVRSMIQRHPEADFSYFIGEDNVAALHTWKEIDELRSLVEFVVLSRGDSTPGCPFPVVSRRIDISSTDIRKRIAAGLSVRYLLPEKTCEIIERHGLYRNE